MMSGDYCYYMRLFIFNVWRKGFEWKWAFLQIHYKRGERKCIAGIDGSSQTVME